jgi:glutaredoxin
MSKTVQVVLYTKPGCGLCEEMKAAIRCARVDHLYTLEEVDIETDAELFAQYRYDIPVLLVNGVEAFRHRLSSDDFRNYVTSLLAGNQETCYWFS